MRYNRYFVLPDISRIYGKYIDPILTIGFSYETQESLTLIKELHFQVATGLGISG